MTWPFENDTSFVVNSTAAGSIDPEKQANLSGSIFSVIVCKRLDIINHCITLKLPWMFLLALAALLAVIYLLFSVYARSELKKTSILSTIRDN